MDDFISERSYEVIDKKMLRKDFIGEREFEQIISPFKEVIKKRGWILLCKHKAAGYASLVREFYTNMVGKKRRLATSGESGSPSTRRR